MLDITELPQDIIDEFFTINRMPANQQEAAVQTFAARLDKLEPAGRASAYYGFQQYVKFDTPLADAVFIGLAKHADDFDDLDNGVIALTKLVRHFRFKNNTDPGRSIIDRLLYYAPDTENPESVFRDLICHSESASAQQLRVLQAARDFLANSDSKDIQPEKRTDLQALIEEKAMAAFTLLLDDRRSYSSNPINETKSNSPGLRLLVRYALRAALSFAAGLLLNTD